jgi:DNA-binding LytR/AlgR family response regulator
MKIAVCDDETVQRELIVTCARQYFIEKKIPVNIQEYSSAEQLIFQYDLHSDIDIVLLDIQMKGMDGITLAKYLRSKNEGLSIIFITAMTDYIYEGFQVNAINYLLKPFENEKLYTCLDKAVEECDKQEELLILRVDKELLKIKKNHILRVEGDGHYIKLVTSDYNYRMKKSMKEIEFELSEQHFLKINRSDIINLHGIERITTKEITLINGDKLLVPKGKHKEISEAFINCHFRREDTSC